MQDKVVDKIEEVVRENIWTAIKDFLEIGWTFGKGETQINLTIGLFILIVLSFFFASFILKWVRKLYTRKMDETDKQKFVDKSLLVGDIIETDGKVGRVIEIKLRTTRAITRDDKIIIIPNHKFITEIIYNYTQNRRTTREFVSVGVAYGSDTELVERLLLESLVNQPGILKSPKPFVLFENFGDSSLDFSVLFFLNDSFTDPKIKSAIRFKIDRLFRENNVTIPFPQRDVHLFNTSVTKSGSDSDNLAID